MREEFSFGISARRGTLLRAVVVQVALGCLVCMLRSAQMSPYLLQAWVREVGLQVVLVDPEGDVVVLSHSLQLIQQLRGR